MIGYRLDDNLQLQVGYTSVQNYDPNDLEHHSNQAINYSTKLAGIGTATRVMLEQRYLDTFTHKIRWLQTFRYPLVPDLFDAVVYDEIFYIFNTDRQGFSENRAFAGGVIKLAEEASVLVGYQHRWIDDGIENHDVMLRLMLDFDFISAPLTSSLRK